MSTRKDRSDRRTGPPVLKRDVFIVALIWLAVSALTLFGSFSRFDLWLTDLVGAPATKVEDKAPVAVVAIDQPSFMEVGERWPWPRSLYADLLASAEQAGAKAVVFDIVFDQPSSEDDAFAAAIEDFGDVVLAAETVVVDMPQGRIESTAMPVRKLAEAASAIGIATIPLDEDGRARRLPQTQDALAYKALGLVHADRAPAVKGDYIRYRTDDAAPEIYSFYQALDASERLPSDALNGKILLVGLALPASPDAASSVDDEIFVPVYAAPQSAGRAPGVVAHAQALASLMKEDVQRRAPMLFELLFAGAFALASFAAATLSRTHLRTSLVVLIGAAALCLASTWILRLNDVVLFFGAALCGWATASVYIVSSAGLHSHKERQRLVRGFGRYVSPAVLKGVIHDPALPALGGELREVSVIVTDLEGFTRFINSVSPEEGADILSRYLDRLGEVVIAHEGLIDQFIGDSIIAIFNAPIEQPDHAARALACVAALEAEGLRFQAEMTAAGKPVGATRIGAHCGEAVVGNFGAKERFHYTAMGEVVNIASRLEAANKETGSRSLVSEDLYRAGDEPERFVAAGPLHLRGISTPLNAFSNAPDDET